MKPDEIKIILESLFEQQKEVLHKMDSFSHLQHQSDNAQDEKAGKADNNLEMLLNNIDRQIAELMQTLSQKQNISPQHFNALNQMLARNIKLMEMPPKELLPQVVQHKHSFTDRKWLIILFIFIGLTGFMSWLYYSAKNEKDMYQIKYSFVKGEYPSYIHLVDSFYQVNPQQMQEFTQKSNEESYSKKNVRHVKSRNKN
ncbi:MULTISPECIES: hypothetical protein [Chitinophagaceae]